MKPYKHADVRFNNGNGALLCNNCSVIIAYGHEHEDREHYCTMCMSGKCNSPAAVSKEWPELYNDCQDEF